MIRICWRKRFFLIPIWRIFHDDRIRRLKNTSIKVMGYVTHTPSLLLRVSPRPVRSVCAIIVVTIAPEPDRRVSTTMGLGRRFCWHSAGRFVFNFTYCPLECQRGGRERNGTAEGSEGGEGRKWDHGRKRDGQRREKIEMNLRRCREGICAGLHSDDNSLLTLVAHVVLEGRSG